MKKNLKDDLLSKEILEDFQTSGPIEDALETLSSGDRLDKDPEFVADSAKMQLVEDILRTMKSQGLSKNELAKRMGTSRQYLSKILNEEEDINFTIETMASISSALGKRLEIRIVGLDESVSVKRITLQKESFPSISSCFPESEEASPNLALIACSQNLKFVA